MADANGGARRMDCPSIMSLAGLTMAYCWRPSSPARPEQSSQDPSRQDDVPISLTPPSASSLLVAASGAGLSCARVGQSFPPVAPTMEGLCPSARPRHRCHGPVHLTPTSVHTKVMRSRCEAGSSSPAHRWTSWCVPSWIKLSSSHCPVTVESTAQLRIALAEARWRKLCSPPAQSLCTPGGDPSFGGFTQFPSNASVPDAAFLS